MARVEPIARTAARLTTSLVLAMIGGIACAWLIGFGLVTSARPANPGLFRVAEFSALPFAIRAPAALFVGVLLGYWTGLGFGLLLLAREALGRPRLRPARRLAPWLWAGAGSACFAPVAVSEAAGVYGVAAAVAFGPAVLGLYALPGALGRALRRIPDSGAGLEGTPEGTAAATATAGAPRRTGERRRLRAAAAFVAAWVVGACALAPLVGGAWTTEPRPPGSEAGNAEQRAAARFRDRWLLGGDAGRRVSDFYYRYSPYALAAAENGRAPGAQATATAIATGVGLGLIKGVFWSWGRLGVAWLAFFGVLAYGALAGPTAARRRAVLVGAGAVAIALATGWADAYMKPAAVRLRSDLAAVATAVAAAPAPGAERTQGLAPFLENARAEVRYEAVFALAEQPAPADAAAFRRGLSDPDARVRLWSAHGLGTLRDAAALGGLIPLLADPSVNVRCHAAWALGELQEPAAEEPLTALRDGDDMMYVRISAADALAALRRRE